MEAIIVGGGIAGLTLALALHQAGISARLYEAVHDPAPLGLGINLQPAAVRELTELGLGAELAKTGVEVQRLSYFNKLGQLICHEKRGLAAGYRWRQYAIHRGLLQALLMRAARERIGDDNVRCGLRLVSFDQSREKVIALFRDSRSGEPFDDTADILVGADGIHSTVRYLLHPGEAEPRFAQQVLWRAAAYANPFLDGATVAIAGHFHQRAIAYPIGGTSMSGQRLTNWICQLAVADTERRREDWNSRVDKAKVLQAFRDWRFPWLDIPALVEQSADIFEFPLIDRDPVDVWTHGRVTLVGDAAHPMQPIGSQAASQAIVDARVLAAALTEISRPGEALLRYDADRRPVMNEITVRNRHFGPEGFLQLVEERAPNGFVRIADVISRDELDTISSSFLAAARFDPATVNASYSQSDAGQQNR
jgi:2-polyprenyl-6-methoxyphenol hydroxylase-like FAD-dependent oxidoreductase